MNNTRYVRCIKNDDYEIDLTIGQVYKSVPLTDAEKDAGVIRVIDNEGEDYLYDASYFEPFQPDGAVSELTDSLTIHLDAFTKGVLKYRLVCSGGAGSDDNPIDAFFSDCF